MASQSRSVQFSDNPVSSIRELSPPPSPPRTPGRMTNNSNVVSTPSRDSCSAYLIGLGTVPQAKELLLRELEGYVEPFNPSYLKDLLDKAANPEACDKYLNLPRGNSVYGKDGWTDLPTKPDAEDELYTPLVKIVNSILRRFNVHTSRRAHDTHDKDMHSEHIEGLKARPDIVITGSGQHFRGELKQCDRWYRCVTTLEVKKELYKTNAKRRKGGEDEEEIVEQCEKKGLAQLAYYARQKFSSQPTRKFVYNILITERRVRLYRFDRVGVQYSNWMNYRDEPSKLIQCICLVAGPDPEKLGLDTTVVFKGKKIQFTLEKDGQPYVVTADHTPCFSSLGLRGRATVCWSVTDKDGNTFLMKQQHVNANREPEHEILAYVQSRIDIDLSAIGRFIMAQTFGEVSLTRGFSKAPEDFHDRRLYRLLLTEYGDRIENLTGKTQLDLLVALRDAISGHRSLWDAGVIHRDISVNNILYRMPSNAESTLRGVLIDMDLAVKLFRDDSNAGVDFRTGTRAFQSICVLESPQFAPEKEDDPVLLHDHVDDLESFFWVLFWITREQVAPGTDPKLLDDKLKVRSQMEAPANESLNFKSRVLRNTFSLKLQAGWSKHILILLKRLALHLETRSFTKRERFCDEKIAATPNELVDIAPADYSTVLEHFDVAIAALKNQMFADPTSPNPPLINNQPEPSRHRTRSLYVTPALLPPAEITVPNRTASKRSREAEPVEEPIETDRPRAAPPPPQKRVRTAKSDSALQGASRPMTRAASLKTLQAKKNGPNAKVDGDEHQRDAEASGTSRGRAAAGQSTQKKASPSRVPSRASTRRTASKGGKKA